MERKGDLMPDDYGVTVVSVKDLALMVAAQTRPTSGMKSALAKAKAKGPGTKSY